MSKLINTILGNKVAESKSRRIDEASVTELEIKAMDFSELLEAFQDSKRLWHFEGEQALENLGEITKALGYGDSYQSATDAFFADNPGVFEGIIEFIRDYGERNKEWKSGMREAVLEEVLSAEPEETEEDPETPAPELPKNVADEPAKPNLRDQIRRDAADNT